jgi:hypothetical protein
MISGREFRLIRFRSVVGSSFSGLRSVAQNAGRGSTPDTSVASSADIVRGLLVTMYLIAGGVQWKSRAMLASDSPLACRSNISVHRARAIFPFREFAILAANAEVAGLGRLKRSAAHITFLCLANN